MYHKFIPENLGNDSNTVKNTIVVCCTRERC